MRTIVTLCLSLAAVVAMLSPLNAFDINAYRRAHKLPPLSHSAMLSGLAASHASDMARRRHLDHDGFKQRMSGSAGAENVAMIVCARPRAKPVSTVAGRACGCDDADCAFRMWTRSAGHRRNMLMRSVSSYGIGSATADNGRRYWVLELGN